MKKLTLIFFITLQLLPVFNSEAQWYLQQSGTTNPLYDIKFINRNTGWACGDGGYIIKTTNGGDNWMQQGNGVTGEPLFGIHPVDSNTVYAIGFFRTLIKTTNGGDTWVKKDSGTSGDGTYTCVYFINENTGWIGNWGPGYGVKRTTNGGNTILSVPFDGILQDMYFKDSLNGVGVGEVSYIYRTTDGGLNWISNSIVFNGDFYRVSFVNGNTGYTASHRAVYKTTNFGVSWDSVGKIDLPMGNVMSIKFCNENTGWAGTNYQMYKTTNAGRNWLIQNSTLPGVVYSISSFNENLVWGCGNGGRIWHTTNGGDTITNIKQISSFFPNSFELKQNYPNPFNPVTKIEFSIKVIGNYKLEIFDITGRKLEEIFNERLVQGSYRVTYNAFNLTSGAYIYKLSTEKFSESKKFLLIK